MDDPNFVKACQISQGKARSGQMVENDEDAYWPQYWSEQSLCGQFHPHRVSQKYRNRPIFSDHWPKQWIFTCQMVMLSFPQFVSIEAAILYD